MATNRRFGTRRETDSDPEPAASTGRSADGADLASTDLSAEPSSREEGTQPVFDEGRGAVPAEPLEEAVRRLEAQVDESRDRQLRLAAEFDNYRKRTSRERAELSDRAQADFVSKLLDVLDDLDRLVVADPATTPLPVLREGLTAVDRKLWKQLQDAGVERIDPVGTPFDPSVHEAVSTVAPPDPSQDHLVSATFQVGYRFKGALVRPARVQVYSAQSQA